jgi:hypothetical protein
MSQNDYNIANQGFPATRSDLNSALQALASCSSGATEPATMYANQLWYDTTASILKIRNEANSAWISYINQDVTTTSSPTFANITTTGIDDNATSTAITIDASENVGIGTAAPTHELVVSDSSTPTIQIKDGLPSGTRVSGRLLIGESDTQGVSIENSTSTYNDTCAMVFKTTPPAGTITERLRIGPTGNVLVGKTVTIVAEPGLGVFPGGLAEITRDGNYPLRLNRKTSNGTILRLDKDATQVGSISVTGSATAFNESSDYRLKKDVIPMSGATERVMALKPVNFAWIVDDSRVDGFIAHEAQAVVPECATGTKDAMRDEEYEVTPATETDEAVMGTRSVPDMQGIDKSKLVPLLTAALQEALTKIEALEVRLSELEGA